MYGTGKEEPKALPDAENELGKRVSGAVSIRGPGVDGTYFEQN
jgi:hypothetical protein